MTMSLLDAALAFALTMAALATVVTIIIEITIVAFGLKARDQVKLVGKLLDESVQGRFAKLDEPEKWQAIKAILNNAVLPSKNQMASDKDSQSYSLGGAHGVYDKVSLEHVLRRLLEIDSLAPLAQMRDDLRANLKAVAAQYDEFRSATAVAFARRTRFWSLIVGIGLAAALNVDGLRLFEAYKNNPELADKVIEEMDPILEKADEALKSQAEKLKEMGKKETSIEDLEKAIGNLKAQLGVVRQLGLPVGDDYYPYCYLGNSAKTAAAGVKLDPLCEPRKDKFLERKQDFLSWTLRILITGLLMGLGAPFWYDVAKRLGQVRQAFGAKGGEAERHKGAEGDESPEARDELIAAVVDDALAGARKTRIFIAQNLNVNRVGQRNR